MASPKPSEPDVSEYMPLVEQFLIAVAKDFKYTELITRNAKAIERRRQIWAAKRKVEGNAEESE